MDRKKEFTRILLIAGMIWFFQALYSTLNTGIFQQLSGQHTRWLAIGIYSFGAAIVWWIFTPLIYAVVIKTNNSKYSRLKQLSIHTICGVSMAAIHRLITILITYNLIKWTEAVDLSLLKWNNFFGFSYLRNVGNGFMIYLIVAAILYGYIFYRRNRDFKLQTTQLESRIKSLQIENLKYQLQPHFLFNSLQGISTLMNKDLNKADRAVGTLGDLLRHSIQSMDKQKILLSEEIYYTQKYLDLQKMRFEERLTTSVKCDDDLLNTQIPYFTLQPLVENSIKHGIERNSKALSIQIDIYQKHGNMTISCQDNNRSSEHETTALGGQGLQNIKSRLLAQFGADFELESGFLPEGGYRTRISIQMTAL